MQVLPILGEYGSQVSYLIPESRHFAEVTILSEDIKKPWLKATLKLIKKIINNQIFIVQDPEKGDHVTPCVDVYRSKTQSACSLDKL